MVIILEKFIRGFAVFFIGADLTIFWLVGANFSYKLWLDDPLTGIFKICMLLVDLGIVTRFGVTISQRIYWPENHEAHVPPYDLYRRPKRKLTNADIARTMQEKYGQKT